MASFLATATFAFLQPDTFVILRPQSRKSHWPRVCVRAGALSVRARSGRLCFSAQPSLDPKHPRDLAACRWIANGENLLLLGPPCVGKTHLAVALGLEAILAGYGVLFISAAALVAQ